MNAVLRRRFEMAERVRDFLRAHRTEGDETTLGRLEALLERVDVLALQQRAGLVEMRASTTRRARVRRELQSTLLHYLSGVARLAARENAGLAVPFKLPRVRIPDLAFLTLVRGMLDTATELSDLFVSHGMSERLLGDLAAAIAEFEQTLEATRAAQREHVGATADLWAVAAQISRQVRVLDGFVRYRFWDQAELRAAWLGAKKVGGPGRAKIETQAVVGEIREDVATAA
jgi:hypothetical protein